MRISVKKLLFQTAYVLAAGWLTFNVRADVSLWQQFDELKKQVRKHQKDKNLDDLRNAHFKMATVVDDMLSKPEIASARKIDAGLEVVIVHIADGEYNAARAICKKLRDLPDLSPSDSMKIQCAVGDIAKSGSTLDEARREYEKALNIPGINENDKFFALDKLATFCWRNLRNQEELKKVVERMVALENPPPRVTNWLRILAGLKPPNTNYRRPETLDFAWSNLLKQPNSSIKDRAWAYIGLLEAKVALRQTEEARQIAQAAETEDELPVATRLAAAFVRIALDAVAENSPLQQATIDSTAKSLEPQQIDIYNALTNAGAVLKTLNEGYVARQFSEMARQLVQQPKNTYLCTYLEKTPLGAGGWFASEQLHHPELRAGNFREYRRKDADALVTDVNAERSVTGENSPKAEYFENTAFYMAYDLQGWHVFVLCGEPNLTKFKNEGKSLGALEMYFAPTPESPYYQWIINLNDGKTDTYDWSSPNRSFRTAEDYIKTETVVKDNNIGVYVFFPWELIYNRLPFDNDSPWIFDLIRWSPAGGLSWSGGRVHNSGKWGHINWQTPTDTALSDIRMNLLRKAWLKYKTKRKELVDNYWQHRDFGDPDFLRNSLMPEVERLNALGEPLEKSTTLTTAKINRLFTDAVGDWMEFDYFVAELRREYLLRKLTE